ncbi:G8 domain-containing protein [uncultured Shewanella sp.]|uniref:G8 domain-containing protein n=1 Tax=uncultured Shewanella sp. TaxID=173975 RepID=UPI002610FC36|nr:G8 domain-containing protein [uncultured Shewanella sp.]
MMRSLSLISAVLLMSSLWLSGCNDNEQNTLPIAHAGSDAQILLDHTVQLDGSKSFDLDDDQLEYHWTILTQPEGSVASLSSTGVVTPYLKADAIGIYTFHLEVWDGQVGSSGHSSHPAARSINEIDLASQVNTSGAAHIMTVNVVEAGGACCLENQFHINTMACKNIDSFAWKNITQCPADANGIIHISNDNNASCQYAYIDKTQSTLSLGKVNIGVGGRLVVLDKNQTLTAETIRINGGSDDHLPKGQLVIGTEHCPIRNVGSQLTLEFTGTRPSDGSADILDGKGIFVGDKGELLMVGSKGVVEGDPTDNNGTKSWTYLSKAAGPARFSATNGVAVPVPAQAADTTLTLSRSVDWAAGDWIVVAGTGFASDESEFVQIATNDSSSGISILTLQSITPLKHYHFGSLAPSTEPLPKSTLCNGVMLEGAANVTGLPSSFCDSAERNYGIDERAAVGLISRSIKLTSDALATGPNAHYGGQIKLLANYDTVNIKGVEIEKFGQDVKQTINGLDMSAYPLHFHMIGEVKNNTTLINSNSIHHSYNKCVTVHMTNNVNIEHNICARAIGHSFYLESGNEVDNTFKYNLAAGAMATEFMPSIDENQFWLGDYLASIIHYDGINVTTTTNGATPVAVPPGSQTFVNVNKVESTNPTGFWISSPGNRFDNNLVAGCQLQGRGYWILPETSAVLHTPLTSFENNRVHSCYNGLDTAADMGSIGQNFTPYENGKNAVAVFNNVTATRNRNRGIWLRPNWYHVSNGRLATNRDSVSLVSAGGSEGSPPGEWSLLSDAVIVGVSQNNPERFGPCPQQGGDGTCYGMQGKGANAIPTASWNFAGFMFYDGPARLENNRFVNFLVDPTDGFNATTNKLPAQSLLTVADNTYLVNYKSKAPGQTLPPYEGDAAMGWFQSNVNNYPPTQYSRASIFENVDLRHQVYTEEVNLSLFVDGDKNTVILDHDGTLSGYKVVDDAGNDVLGKYPISLNNLAFNGSPYSVDECLATGAQDKIIENRASALMSPQSFATLEFTAWDPTFSITGPNPELNLVKKFPITFIKDAQDYIGSTSSYAPTDAHYSMTLVGRNNTQVREPKVMNGMGYTLHSTQECTEVGAHTVKGQAVPLIAPPSALPRYVSMGFTDATSEFNHDGSWKRPFRIRVGLCYKTQKGPNVSAIVPSDFFEVKKGRKSYGGPTGPTDPSWKPISGCNNLAFTDVNNFDAAGGTDPNNIQPGCPGTLDPVNDKVKTLSQAPSWSEFIHEDNDDQYYWWDGSKGMLFFYIEQKQPNLTGGTPLATCGPNGTGGAMCDLANDFYPCPAEGCVLYTVRVVDDGAMPIKYAPTKVGNDYGATACDDVYNSTSGRDYTQSYPPNETVNWASHKLALIDGTVLKEADITAIADNEGSFYCTTTPTAPAPTCAVPAANARCHNNFPHNTTTTIAPHCAVNALSLE